MNGRVKILHWDYKERQGVLSPSSDIQLITRRTDEGFYLRWVLQVFVESRQVLSCIAESQHKCDVRSITVEDFIKTVNNSLMEFSHLLHGELSNTKLSLSFGVNLSRKDATEFLRGLINE